MQRAATIRHRLPRAVPCVLAVLLALAPAAGGASASGVFTDVTAGSGIDFVHTFGDEEMSNLVESSGYGVCLFDADGDGRLDVYLVNGSVHPEVSDLPEDAGAATAGLPLPTNRLYLNSTARADGGGPAALRFRDVTEAAGVGDTGFGMGCVAGDLDGDGDRDLVVTNYGPNRVYRNDGPDAGGVPRFTEVAGETGLDDPAWGMGAALLDVDGDGLLDLYVGNYVRFDPDYRAYYVTDRFPGPLAYPGSPDRLWRNATGPDGAWRFEDITERAGVGNPEGRAMGIGVSDLDRDGRPDVFVSNDAMANSLFRNRGDGTFEDVAPMTGVGYSANGDATAAMGVDLGDLDGDGNFEILVPDMSFSTLYTSLPGAAGRPAGLFEDRSRQWGLALVAAQYVGWSGHLLDYDLDGRLDLFMTTGDLHDVEPTEDVLLHNEPDGRLRDAAAEGGEHFRNPTMGRGAAVGDLDDDGDPDLVLNVLAGHAIVLRNDQATGNHWLGVRLVGTKSNRDGVGSLVEVETGSGEARRVQIREIQAGEGYLGSGDPRALFGLGAAAEAVRITVRWPSGVVTTREGVAADRYVTIEEEVEPAP
ncbi:MAG: CRTAC1 family protein [Acidobacteriota bacterium]|jgi:hypothetical protein